MYAACPNCFTNIKIEQPEFDKHLHCPTCMMILVIVWLFPIELELKHPDKNLERLN